MSEERISEHGDDASADEHAAEEQPATPVLRLEVRRVERRIPGVGAARFHAPLASPDRLLRKLLRFAENVGDDLRPQPRFRAAASGDAFLAAAAAGLCRREADWNSTTSIVEPDPAHAAVYADLYELYRSLYPATVQEMHALAAIQAEARFARDSEIREIARDAAAERAWRAHDDDVPTKEVTTRGARHDIGL
jgi:hypothetical protein